MGTLNKAIDKYGIWKIHMVYVIFLNINNYIRKMTSYSDIILYKYIPSKQKGSHPFPL